MKTTYELFLEKVASTPANGCWIWIGGRNSKGYGTFAYGGHCGFAHRFSYQIHKEAIPPGFEVDHVCRAKACVNPAHLEVVTGTENMIRHHASKAHTTPAPS